MQLGKEQLWILKSIKGFKNGRSDATLCSKQLDRTMHPSGCVRVGVAGASTKKSPGYTLDPFTRASLEAYLNSQPHVKKTLEEQLFAEQVEWGAKPPLRGNSVWELVQIELVAFEEKIVQTPQGLANLKKMFPGIDIQRVRQSGDQPKTRTRFTLQLNVGWDPEHARLATFRDGKFASLELY
jgi:hypothetical protein